MIFVPLACAAEAGDETPASAPEQEEQSADEMDPRVRWLKAAEKAIDERADKQQTGERRRRVPWFLDDELLARAGIGEDQADQIRQVIVDTDAEMKALKTKTGSETGTTIRELTRILSSDDFSEERADELLDRILEQRNVLTRAQLEPRIRVRALLSASQVAALRAERPRFFMEPLAIPAAPQQPSGLEDNQEPPPESAGDEAG